MDDDIRTKLRRADALLREERYAQAVGLHQAVADAFTQGGFVLKAVAVLRQIIDITERAGPELADARRHALRELAQGYTALGLTTDAAETRRRLD